MKHRVAISRMINGEAYFATGSGAMMASPADTRERYSSRAIVSTAHAASCLVYDDCDEMKTV